jgi:GNAT superfamily N-acetyltransferase
MAVRVDESLDGIDWVQAKADLAADDFDNGRSPQALRASFEQSQHVAIAWDGDRVVGMARLLSDGVCNAYLLDVWTMSAYRRQGIGTTMVRQLMSRVPGQHIGLQTEDAEAFYASLGYHHQPVFMSAVVGEWLANEANARLRAGAVQSDFRRRLQPGRTTHRGGGMGRYASATPCRRCRPCAVPTRR